MTERTTIVVTPRDRFSTAESGQMTRWWPSGLSLAVDKVRYRFFTIFRY